MSEVVDIFKKIPKSDLIKVYRHKLKEEGKFSRAGVNRPTVNGKRMSWNEFERLPKAAIIVHTFTEGCDVPFIVKMTQEGFFNKPVPISEQEGSKFVYIPNSKYSNRGYHWCSAKVLKEFKEEEYITGEQQAKNSYERFINSIADQSKVKEFASQLDKLEQKGGEEE